MQKTISNRNLREDGNDCSNPRARLYVVSNFEQTDKKEVIATNEKNILLDSSNRALMVIIEDDTHYNIAYVPVFIRPIDADKVTILSRPGLDFKMSELSIYGLENTREIPLETYNALFTQYNKENKERSRNEHFTSFSQFLLEYLDIESLFKYRIIN